MPTVDRARITRALSRVARRPKANHPSRLWALLPTKVAASGRQMINSGAGVYLGELSQTERWLIGDRRGWSVRVTWDLRQLWQSNRRPRPSKLSHILRTDHIAERVAKTLMKVGRARATAMRLSAGTPGCVQAQTTAEAAILRLRSLLAAVNSR
ncbi:MAG: hypothetical protein KC502_02120 [Myxococcales bacterium]|nr:hypothetical protein [Myxococcales bacterium]